jgi:DNA mismatch endonuclease (patch repair protein)
VKRLKDIAHLEAVLFKAFDRKKALMNGSIPVLSRRASGKIPPPAQTVQVMSDEDIKVRRDPMLRLPRQIEHIGRLVDHILSVKDSSQLRRSLALMPTARRFCGRPDQSYAGAMTRMTSKERSAVMRAVKSRNTKPELFVRKLAHSLGFRFRLYGKNLPGSPDLVFAGRRKVIFVHGCFWHGHSCARGARIPKTNRDYWLAKIARNVARDKAAARKLRKLGWKVLILWECKLKDSEKLRTTIMKFLA